MAEGAAAGGMRLPSRSTRGNRCVLASTRERACSADAWHARSMGALLNEARDEGDEEFWGQAAFAEVRACETPAGRCPTHCAACRGARRAALTTRCRRRLTRSTFRRLRRRTSLTATSATARHVPAGLHGAVPVPDAARAQEEDDDDEGGDDEPKCVCATALAAVALLCTPPDALRTPPQAPRRAEAAGRQAEAEEAARRAQG